jgi:hypothetical protein
MKSNKEHKCGVCAIPDFERNNYYYGKQITVRDSVQEQLFFNEKRHLINRMVLGWGVVCGLDVEWDRKTHEFVVSQGLALDCCGREILVCDARIKFDQYQHHCECYREKREPPVHRYILCLEYHECKSDPVELPPLSCDSTERQEANRIKESYRLTLKEWKADQKPEEVCLKRCRGHLPCPDHVKKPISADREQLPCHAETLHSLLCSSSRKGCPECECCDCVVLAVITVKHEHKGYPPGPGHQQTAPTQQEEEPDVHIDQCTYRRLVYSNPLLYDLIYCYHGDLPHIVDFNWRALTHPDREIHPEDFLALLQTGLTFTFDREMTQHSLNSHTIIVTLLRYDRSPNTYLEGRIRAKSVACNPGPPCFTTTWHADDSFVNQELVPNLTEFDGAQVEIQVRGSRVWDTNGKALDGEFIADKLPTGNGVQGGDFIDWFTIRNKCEKKAHHYGYAAKGQAK